MRANHVKEKLKRDQITLGAWLSLPCIASARVIARLGFDWLLVDMEHCAQTPALMTDMLATIADAGTSAPFVRIPFNSVEWFKWALDAGTWGVVVPMVNTRTEAENAVSWSKYPPMGTRSNGGTFAPYGFGITNRQEYTQAANEEILVVVQIESIKALQNLDEILSVPGIDAAFVGPNDLRMSLGLRPAHEGDEPEFLDALETIKRATRKYGIASGIMSSGGAAAAERIRQGFRMITVATDINCMIDAAQQNLRIALGE